MSEILNILPKILLYDEINISYRITVGGDFTCGGTNYYYDST